MLYGPECAAGWAQVWTEYAGHVIGEGLTAQGLAQLYLDGFADAQQDYERLAALENLAGAAGANAEQVRHGQDIVLLLVFFPSFFCPQYGRRLAMEMPKERIFTAGAPA